MIFILFLSDIIVASATVVSTLKVFSSDRTFPAVVQISYTREFYNIINIIGLYYT